MNAITPITMPKWGMTMTEGKIAAWLVGEGEIIESGSEYVEIETEKITNVVEAAQGGRLRRIVAGEGQTIPCGGLIGVLADNDVPDSEIETFLSTFEPVEQDDANGAQSQSQKIESAGCSVNVVSFASADDHEALPLILVHGFGADSRAWLFNSEALANGRPVHAIELPSHGESAVDASAMSLERLAEIVSETIRQLAPEGAHLAGHSLGGRIALRIAAESTGSIKSLVLLAPAGFSDKLNLEFIESFIEAERRRPMKAALRFLVHDTDLITSEMIEQTLSYKHIDGVNAALRATAESNFTKNQVSEDTENELDRVDCPILVLWGEADQVVPVEGAKLASERAEIITVPNVGHLLQMEASEKVNEAINRFVEAAT